MTRDVKLIQRGVNVQANDMAVPPGTPLRAVNIDYQRDGVAQRRVGFESFYAGLPTGEIDYSVWNQSIYTNNQIQQNRGFFELFSRDRLMCQTNGLMFAYDDFLTRWVSVPVNLPHRWTYFGNASSNINEGWLSGFGRAIAQTLPPASPFRWQESVLGVTSTNVYGAIANSVPATTAKFSQIQDTVTAFGNVYVTDQHAVRTLTGSVFAGSITVSGTTDATGTSARFSSPSYMTTLGLYIYVVDNTNQIRRINSLGAVTTFAGSITAGDTDGTGTAARFRGISGITNDGTDLFVVESGGHRVRKITTAGVVTIYAGQLTPTAGYVDSATSGSVRFNTPIGIEYDSQSQLLYVGDTVNNRVRSIASSPAGSTSTHAGSASTPVDGVVGGLSSSAILPGVSLRGLHAANDGTRQLIVECTTASAASIDVALVSTGSDSGSYTMSASDINVYHVARCPSSMPNITTGPNKFDSVGPNAWGLKYVRGVDAGGGVVFTTSERPRAIDIWTRVKSGDPLPRFRTLGVNTPEAPSVTTVAGTTFAANSAWAYRTLCGLKLPDGRITTGAPSERIVCIGSTTATCAGSVTAFPAPSLPYDGMPFIQVYRTKTVASTLDPGDQMFLCYESALSYGNGVVFTDQLPDALLGSELYTNATADGIAYASLPPPGFVGDVASFGDSLVVANTVPLATVRVKCLGVASLTAGQTLTLTVSAGVYYQLPNTLTLTAIAGVTLPESNSFQIGTGGTATQNAVQTARNIVRCINRGCDGYIYRADYDESDPGAFVITCLYPGVSPSLIGYQGFGSNVASLTQCGVTIGGTALGTSFITIASNIATRQQNALAYSDQKIYDSFPIVYGISVGPSTESIQRLLPISDTLLAVKDDSIWRMDANFVPQIYDSALTCETPGSFAKVNNQWIGLFTRGFVALNSSQATALGRNVDRDVVSSYSQFYGSLTAPFASAAAIDVTGNYLCTVNRKTYCYNAIAQAWSEWQVNVLVSQYPDGGTSTKNQTSGMLSVGAFRDGFITSNDSIRSVGRQRDYNRSSYSWYKAFSDLSYNLVASVQSGLQSLSFQFYNATNSNPGPMAPKIWSPPSGLIADVNNAAASFLWSFEVTQGASSAVVQGVVSSYTGSDPLEVISATLITPLTGFSVGALTTCIAYPPIICRVQYAPSVSPGSDAMFGDMLVTVERAQPGWLIARFFNRNDFGDATIPADGDYLDTYGVSRANLMPSITVSNSSGLGGLYNYHDPQRFFVPSERVSDQVLGVELWEGNAWQPFAIKSVSPDKRVKDNAKVTR